MWRLSGHGCIWSCLMSSVLCGSVPQLPSGRIVDRGKQYSLAHCGWQLHSHLGSVFAGSYFLSVGTTSLRKSVQPLPNGHLDPTSHGGFTWFVIGRNISQLDCRFHTAYYPVIVHIPTREFLLRLSSISRFCILFIRFPISFSKSIDLLMTSSRHTSVETGC